MIVAESLPVGRVLRRLSMPIAALLAYDLLITVLYVGFGQRWVGLDNLPLSLLGSALAIIMGLRNNSAYSRWWEARTLWGSAVNNSRSLARGAIAMMGKGDGTRRLLHLQVAWARALRLSLWKQDTGPATALLPEELRRTVQARLAGHTNIPAALQMEMGLLLNGLAGEGKLDPIRLAALDAILGRLADAQGGLERIRNTPLPRQFDHFQLVFVTAYCLLLPIGLVSDLGIATPVGSTVIGIAFLTLDRIGRDLQDPFGRTVHDIPMNAIVRTIETDLLQAMDDASALPAVKPVEGVLV